jgi:hypothetical protein
VYFFRIAARCCHGRFKFQFSWQAESVKTVRATQVRKKEGVHSELISQESYLVEMPPADWSSRRAGRLVETLCCAVCYATRRRNPFGLNVMKNFSRPRSTTKRRSCSRKLLTASIGPGPKKGATGWPLRFVSSTMR